MDLRPRQKAMSFLKARTSNIRWMRVTANVRARSHGEVSVAIRRRLSGSSESLPVGHRGPSSGSWWGGWRDLILWVSQSQGGANPLHSLLAYNPK